jgi:leader peptidase (prepilin peptidase)/N-methyltransferase
MNCGKSIKAYDLIPVFSYIFLKGKCRHCKTKISFRYPMVEILTSGIFVLLFYKFGPTSDFIFSSYMMAILIAVFFIDLDHYIIPDGLVLAGLAGGAALIIFNLFQPVYMYGDRAFYNPLIGMVLASGFLFAVALVGGAIFKTEDAMGMGDVKIYIPIGMFLGWKMVLLSLFISIVLSGVTGLLLIITKVRDKSDTIPLGPFIVTGTFITFMWGWDIVKWYFGY